MITYQRISAGITEVRLDGKKAGTILFVQVGNRYGYQYFPLKTKQGGEVFKTEAKCRKSLEAE